MTDGWMPGAVSAPIDSHGGAMTDHLGLVLHVTTNHFDPRGYFSNPNDQASSTWWVAEDGTIEQYVSALNRAWAQAAGNATYNSVETSGTPDQPMTPAQVESVAHIYVYGVHAFGWPLQLSETPGVRGFGWHGMGHAEGWGHAFCPGEPRRNQRQAVLDRARVLLGTPVTTRQPGIGPPPTTSEGDDMQELVQAPGDKNVYVSNDITLRRVSGPSELARLLHKYGAVQDRPADQLSTIPGYVKPAA